NRGSLTGSGGSNPPSSATHSIRCPAISGAFLFFRTANQSAALSERVRKNKNAAARLRRMEWVDTPPQGSPKVIPKVNQRTTANWTTTTINAQLGNGQTKRSFDRPARKNKNAAARLRRMEWVDTPLFGITEGNPS